jgi:hypothetical protein
MLFVSRYPEMNKKPIFYIIAALIISGWMFSPPATADWINLSGAQNAPNIAEIHINDDHVKVELEIYVNDLVAFDRLIPDEFFEGSKIKRDSLEERMQQFSNEDLQVIADNGQKLQATLKLIEPRFRLERPSPVRWKVNPYTGQPIPGPPEDKRVLYAELIYPFKKKPTSLTLTPPLDEENRISKVPIGFMTYHKGAPLHDFKYLSEPSTVKLDWADPWYSVFDNKALRRWQRGGVMSFLYIEPYEVRHEVLARVKDLAAWIDLGLRGEEFIEADENDLLKKRVGDFFLQGDQTLIDGKRLRPILDRVSFVKYSTTASTFVVQPERLPINTAMVGVIITYLTGGLPQQVTSQWDLWSKNIRKVPTNAIDPAGGLPSYVTPDDNVLTWTNFLKTYVPPTVARIKVDASFTTVKIPLASVLCLLALLPLGMQIKKHRKNIRSLGIYTGMAMLFIAGSFLLYPFLKVSVAKPAVLAPKITNEQAVSVLDELLKNIYRSFDFREEADVYDRLATSVSGDLLSEIYLQNRKSMVVAQAGGARARVKEVKILDVDTNNLDDNPIGVLFHAKWTAMGSVGHWGHIHVRKNQYEANITVEPVDGAWKITDLELLEEKRIDPYAGFDTKK